MTYRTIKDLEDSLRKFAALRDWEQFHTPKNLTMALAGEVGELIEHFQWLTQEASREAMRDEETATQIRDEMADVLIYLTRLADELEVDLLAAAFDKVQRNEERYPAHEVRGRADVKPTEPI